MANNRNLINAFDDCVQRLDAGENLDDILKDYPDSADYLRDLLMIGEMVGQIHNEDDEAIQAQSRGRARLQQELKIKEKPKRRASSNRPRWYVATVAAASFVLLLGAGFLALALTNSADPAFDMTRTGIAQFNTTTEALIQATQTQVYFDYSLTATELINEVTQVAHNPTIVPPDEFELTATQIVSDVTSTQSAIDGDSTIQAIMPTLAPVEENFDITATALLMPTITLVGSPIPPTLSPVPTNFPSTFDPNLVVSTTESLSPVQAAQTTATALAAVFNQTPTVVPLDSGSVATSTPTFSFGGGGVDGDGPPLPNTGGGGNGVDNAIKTTSMPVLPTSTTTSTATPAPTQTALPTQVADAGIYLTAPVQPDAQPTALPALIPLSAGEIDDNADWDRYLLYRREFLARGYSVYDLDVTGRQIITVLDEEQNPVLGAAVRIFANGAVISETVTYATGQTMFLPNLDERSKGENEFFVIVEKEGVSAQFMLNRNESTEWTVTLPLTIDRTGVMLDVLFLIDTTSSMGDEISQLQNNILHISDQVDGFADNIDVRYGLVLYREFENFEYVTRRHDFTGDVSDFQTNLNAVTANSGDNNPDWDEALNTGLNEALNMMSWRAEDTIKLIFLVADARPHIDHPLEPRTYDESILYALSQGIKIHPIASSGLETDGEYIFRQIAQVTMGHFLFLTYEIGIPGTPGDIRPEFNVGEPETSDPDDGYTVDRLADIVLRLIQDEINVYRGLLVP